MAWLAEILEQLGQQPVVGYTPQTAPAAEPSALAALALMAHGRPEPALVAGEFVRRCQNLDGAVGIRAGETIPGWPSSLAILAWNAVDKEKFSGAISLARNWVLGMQGQTSEQSEEFGHNTMLVGWSWADGTHSWSEPTALQVIALKRIGDGGHARTREAIRLLIDRLLPAGGCNYGNTTVLGQVLRPHVQPTGVVLTALAGEPDRDGRMEKSIAYLRNTLGKQSTATSLAWGLLGLAAHKIQPPQAQDWLAAAHVRVMQHDRSPHKLALLALAAAGRI